MCRSSVGVLFVAESAQHFVRVPAPWPGTKTTTSRFYKQLAVGRQQSPAARQATGTGEKLILLFSQGTDKCDLLGVEPGGSDGKALTRKD